MLAGVSVVDSGASGPHSNRTRIMTKASDRRASPRYSTGPHHTHVQLIGPFGCGITKARLVNISYHGALILTDDVIPLHQPLEVRLDDVPETGWIKAEAVRFGQPHEVGIRFDSPVEYYVLEAALSGLGNEWLRENEKETTQGIETELARRGPMTPSEC
jgi:hypothetical protein